MREEIIDFTWDWYPPKELRRDLTAFRIFFIIGSMSVLLLIAAPLTLDYINWNEIFLAIICSSFIGIVLFISASIMSLIIIYRAWSVIQDGRARTTPGQAVGLLFIPVFSFYWIFVTLIGLAIDHNNYVQQHGILDAKINKALATNYCIWSIVSLILSSLAFVSRYFYIVNIIILIPVMIMFYFYIGQVGKCTIRICQWKVEPFKIGSKKEEKHSQATILKEEKTEESNKENLAPVTPYHTSPPPIPRPPRPPRFPQPDQNKMHSTQPIKQKSIHMNQKYRKELPGIQLNTISSSTERAIPDYTLTHKIGSGGFATVYKALDDHGNPVALKLPKFMDETMDYTHLKKFETEAEIWNKLTHDNIVEFYEAKTIPMVYLAIELMEGGSLKDLMTNHPLSTGEAVDIMLQILDGMSYAHRMATIHRDIKPENILFTADGTAKVSDWGIGKFMASEGATKSMGAKGTLLYSAPEQISKKKFGEVDWTTDVFQLGILFYEMLTGENPFFDEDSAGIVGNIMYEEPEPPSVHNREVTKELDHIVMRALEKKKEDRWRSADVMYDRLRELVD